LIKYINKKITIFKHQNLKLYKLIKLLILGGSGFFGKSIVSYLIKDKKAKHKINEITIISRSKVSHNFKENNIFFRFISNDFKKLKKIPEVDYIIYCLRNNNPNISKKYYNHFLKLIRKYKKKPKILFTSSGAVYGNRIIKRSENKKKYTENSVITKNKIYQLDNDKIKYALEKIYMEKKFKQLGKQKYEVSIARCFNYIGKEILNSNQAIGFLIRDVLYHNTIKLMTTINVFRGFQSADDMSNWLLTIIKNSNYDCPIYNVGSNKSVNIRSVAKILGKMYKKKVLLNKLNSTKCDYYVPSTTKAKNLLKLKNSISLISSLSKFKKYNYEKNFDRNSNL